jgi:hypothetical protein
MPDTQGPPDKHQDSPSDGAANGPTEGHAKQGSEKPGQGKQPPPKPPLSPTVAQLALEAGWTMAVLYPMTEPDPPGKLSGLPTANELPPEYRRQLELGRLSHLLQSLAGMPGFEKANLQTLKVPEPGESGLALQDALSTLSKDILCALAMVQSQALLAYELGRSLRDTASPPDKHPAGAADQNRTRAALSRQFARGRIAMLQGWLAALSGELPQRSAAVVAASLGRWSTFVDVTNGPSRPGLKDEEDAKAAPANPGGQGQDASHPDTAAAATTKYLLRQGDQWLMLLTGTRPASGLLSPEGYAAAGELALRRSAAIIRRVLQHYWAALATVAIALGVTLYLAATYAGGAAKVWTSIAAIAASVGISAQAIASTTARLAAEAERPVFTMAEEDVMAWAITTMPRVSLTPRKVRKLRKAGIAPASSLGRV